MKPERFDADPTNADASKQWLHWYRTFQNFLSTIAEFKPNELNTLVNYVSSQVYDLISDCQSYEDAIAILEQTYVQPKNEVFSRHLLFACKQDEGQTIDQYLHKLNSLAKDCNYQPVDAEEHRKEAVQVAFISGILNRTIQTRLLEMRSMNLHSTVEQAKLLEAAQLQSKSYNLPHSLPCSAVPDQKQHVTLTTDDSDPTLSAADNTCCFFCGYPRHPRSKCPAKDAICKGCNKKGHFLKVCRTSKVKTRSTNSILSSLTLAASPRSLSLAVTQVLVNDIPLQALIDTGSTESFVSSSVTRRYKWPIVPSQNTITLASTSCTSITTGHCFVNVAFKNKVYHRFRLSVLNNLCSDVLLGHDFLRLHQSLEIPFYGANPPLSLCGLSAVNIDPPSLFEHLSPQCRPIATKSRRHSFQDTIFIEKKIQDLLSDGIIEPSKSPWRAQVLVTTNENHKRRMVVDYSQTINRFTLLDAYPLPHMNNLIQKIASYRVFTTVDLRDAYHQIPIRDSDKPYTAFEACGNLYQFRRIPFGVTNGVACFQRVIDEIIRQENLRDTFAYIDNVTICGKDLNEHNTNLANFNRVTERYGITLNHSKSIIASEKINLLGYEIENGSIKPDAERFRCLRELAPPHDLKSQQRVVGLFSYYSQWIPKFSDKAYPIVHNRIFPPPSTVLETFNTLKVELENAAVVVVDRNSPLVVETDASDVAIAATLSQRGKPVAFFSRTLSPTERRHPSIEKEACAIVEAVRKWRHYLQGTHFKLITDQKSVAFMYDQHSSKIKNDKILRWRLELSGFSYDIVYRPGTENTVADALSRNCGATVSSMEQLRVLHGNLCHPGVVRMMHFVRSRNLPYSIAEVRTVTHECRICSEVKPRFYSSPPFKLIKATQSFERISIDFKGPLPSGSTNRYLLTCVDEFSRFPFAFACSDMSTSTVIHCLTQLFAMFGMPSYVHSDRGASFMSNELQQFLHEKGIATSRTTSYNPQGNGQVERLNSTLWRAILLSLKSRKLPISHWEDVLLDALHSIRSLLCTSTNCTPHERLFSYCRKSTSGTSIPTWLASPGPVLLRRHNRASKYDPLVEEVELLQCNPQYAVVRLSDGREDTVALRHLAPVGEEAPEDQVPPSTTDQPTQNSTPEHTDTPTTVQLEEDVNSLPNDGIESQNVDELIKLQQRTRPYALRNREV